MYDLPTEIIIDNLTYKIRHQGDYRMTIDVINVLQTPELSKNEAVTAALLIFYENEIVPPDTTKAAEEMMNFINCNDEYTGHKSNIKLIDWEQDSNLITAGVNRVMGKEVRAEKYIHWFTFIAAYMEIGESQLSYIVGIRNKVAHGKKLEKHEREFKNINPRYFIWEKDKIKDEEAKKEIMNIWNKQ